MFEKCKKVTTLMSEFEKPWFFIGGWAVDLFIGQETRAHHDIEIGILRKDQLELRDYLVEWDIKKIVNREFFPWEGEYIERPVHQLYAQNKVNGEILEIFLNESTDIEYKFRRDHSISCPIELASSHTESGIPYLNPEITLLYKVKNTRDKDHQDFLQVKDKLKQSQKEWLRNAIKSHVQEHPWLQHL